MVLNSGQIIEKFQSCGSDANMVPLSSHNPDYLNSREASIAKNNPVLLRPTLEEYAELRYKQESPDHHLVYQSYSSYQPPHISGVVQRSHDQTAPHQFSKKTTVEVISSTN